MHRINHQVPLAGGYLLLTHLAAYPEDVPPEITDRDTELDPDIQPPWECDAAQKTDLKSFSRRPSWIALSKLHCYNRLVATRVPLV